MSIAIIGRGRMGKNLLPLLADAGEAAVVLGRNEPLPKDTHLIILAVPAAEATKALAAAGDPSGKIIADMVNPIGEGLALTVGHTTSVAEEIQKAYPKAKVVKAFNTVFAELLTLDYAEQANPPQVMFAGDDADAKAEVARVIEAIGFEPFDCGALKTARYLEPIGGLIVDLAYGQGRGTRLAPRMDQY
jgi:predicted dinucleotide-binding enzyme